MPVISTKTIVATAASKLLVSAFENSGFSNRASYHLKLTPSNGGPVEAPELKENRTTRITGAKRKAMITTAAIQEKIRARRLIAAPASPPDSRAR